MAIVW